MSKDYPLLLSGPMVRATLDGRKTMTRRLAWRKPRWAPGIACWHGFDACPECDKPKPTIWQKVRAGDRLWGRETWGEIHATSSPAGNPIDGHVIYRESDLEPEGWQPEPFRWRPSIHMPRWASRITLVVTATKMERLLDISEEDARAEGFEDGRLDDGFGPRDIGGGYTIESPGTYASAAGMFQIAWGKLHPDWDGFDSPEVIALTFSVHHQNIDRMEAA